jgi:hypothetical protein
MSSSDACTALDVYQPQPIKAALSHDLSVWHGAGLGYASTSNVIAALAHHVCTGTTAQAQMQLARSDDGLLRAFQAHQSKVQQTLKRKMAEALLEAERNIEAFTSILASPQVRFSVGVLRSFERHGDTLYIIDAVVRVVRVVRDLNDEERSKQLQIRIALPCEYALDFMSEEDVSCGDFGFVEIMDALCEIAVVKKQLDATVWKASGKASDTDISLERFGAFMYYEHVKHMGNVRGAALVKALTEDSSSASHPSPSNASAKRVSRRSAGHAAAKSLEESMSPPARVLPDSALVDAVIYPASFYTKQGVQGASTQIFSPHAVSNSSVRSLMPVQLVKNESFGTENVHDDDDDDDNRDQGNEEDRQETAKCATKRARLHM